MIASETMQAVLLFLGGALGAFCRAGFSDTQATRSRRTLIDCVIGGFMGILLPILPLERLFGITIDLSLTVAQLMALAGIAAFIGNWATTLIGWKFGYIKRGKTREDYE